MNENVNVTSEARAQSPTLPFYRRVVWGAVFAGLLIGLATNFALSLLGVALGATTVGLREGDFPARGIGIGAGIWMLFTSLIATYIGARLAANLSGAVRKADGALHGMLTWAMATIIMGLFLTGTLGMVAGGAMNVVGQAVGTQAQVRVQQGDAPMGGTAETYEQQSGVAGAPAESGQMQERTRAATDKTAEATAQASFWSFVLLALTALVAGLAGAAGRKRADQTAYSATPA